MDDTCTTGSRPAVDDERFEVRCIFDIFTDGRKRIWKSLDLPAEMLMTNDPIKERTCLHWGQGGLETNENILSTLQALVESTCHLPADNRLGTFQMFLQVPGQTHDVGTFMEHFECNINMCNTFDPP